MIPFSIESREAEGGVLVAALAGRLNAASAPEAKARLKALAGEGPGRLVLDLASLSFIDSSGLAALIAGYKAAIEAGGDLRLARVTPQVAQVLVLTHLDRVFETYPEVEDAVRSFGGAGS